jgi:hypothetical protein
MSADELRQGGGWKKKGRASGRGMLFVRVRNRSLMIPSPHHVQQQQWDSGRSHCRPSNSYRITFDLDQRTVPRATKAIICPLRTRLRHRSYLVLAQCGRGSTHFLLSGFPHTSMRDSKCDRLNTYIPLPALYARHPSECWITQVWCGLQRESRAVAQ